MVATDRFAALTAADRFPRGPSVRSGAIGLFKRFCSGDSPQGRGKRWSTAGAPVTRGRFQATVLCRRRRCRRWSATLRISRSTLKVRSVRRSRYRYSAAPNVDRYVLGARPNFVKMAPVIADLRQRFPDGRHTIIHSGQHYDRMMSQVFLGELGVPEPDLCSPPAASACGADWITRRVCSGFPSADLCI